MSLALQKRRMVAMFAITAICLFFAIVAFVGSIRFQSTWLMAAFFILMMAGFGAQIWFVLGFMKPKGDE